MKYPNINHCWGSLIIDEMARNGIEYFCLAPGSRCAPLVVSIARHKKIKSFVHFDERGLAFHALGYASAAKKPAVLVCTSGTAVANFLPAIVEASKKKIPLIVLTADRPPELRQSGAVQTIEQPGIFGKYIVWQTDMPCPDLNIKPEFVLTTVDQSVYQAVRRCGVSHINCMFRDPLVPVEVKTVWGGYLNGLKAWEKSDKPYTEYVTGFESIRIPDTKKIAGRINALKKGIVVAGKLGSEAERNAVIHFARRLGWPIFADISSGLRLGNGDEGIIHYFDKILLPDGAYDKIQADGIVHFGGRMTSKRYYEFIKAKQPLEYIMILNHPLRSDPLHAVTLRIETTAANFCESVGPLIKPRDKNKNCLDLVKADRGMGKTIEKYFETDGRLSEAYAARLVSQLVPKDSGLFLANSMPIRYMDMYGDFKGHLVHVCGNRGTSGIDGLIASACGYAQGLQAPLTLMIGDLAALHDLNSLAICRDLQVPFIMVVLNNGGGGIFSFLPIAQYTDVFEKFFGTPHPYTFANAAAMFELNYSRPHDVSSFKKAYKQALTSKTATIIEVITNREENVKIHKGI